MAAIIDVVGTYDEYTADLTVGTPEGIPLLLLNDTVGSAEGIPVGVLGEAVGIPVGVLGEEYGESACRTEAVGMAEGVRAEDWSGEGSLGIAALSE